MGKAKAVVKALTKGKAGKTLTKRQIELKEKAKLLLAKKKADAAYAAYVKKHKAGEKSVASKLKKETQAQKEKRQELEYEASRSRGYTPMNKGGMAKKKKKTMARGGAMAMKKKGMAKGGMKKKGYSRGGATKRVMKK